MEQGNKCAKRIAVVPLGFREKDSIDFILQSFLSDFDDVVMFPAEHKTRADYDGVRLCNPDLIIFLMSEEGYDSIVPVGYMDYKTRKQILDISESQKLVLEISDCFNQKRRYPLNHNSFFCLRYSAVKDNDFYFEYKNPMVRARFDFVGKQREENLTLIKKGILNYFKAKEEQP